MNSEQQYISHEMFIPGIAIMSDLFHNAVTSIQLGVEDFQSNDDRRPVSALRNFYAGVLLLGKQCLLSAAPSVNPMDVLASKFTPALKEGNVIHIPKGYQTIELNELRERFKAFDLPWPEGNIKDLQKLRNDFEHFHSDAPKEVVRQAIASCFPLIESFFSILNRSPKDELGEVWDIMLSERDFFRKLKEDCNATFNSVEWWSEIVERDNIACRLCGSSLIYQKDSSNSEPSEISGSCKACGAEIPAEQIIEIIVKAGFYVDKYSVVKDGASELIHDCPECCNETYVNDVSDPKCFYCGYAIVGDCARCGTSLNIGNKAFDSDILCDYCDHMSSKDD